jgi:TolB protein
MMMTRYLFALLLLAAPAPVWAQAQPVAPPPAAQPSPAPEEDGLTGEVTDESAWQDLGIAIPSFATNANQPTPANAQGTGALGLELARVVYNDLRNNGLFKPTGPDSLPRPAYEQITAPAFSTWQGRGTEMLVQGYVRAGEGGQLTVGCYLYDVQLQQERTRAGWVVSPTAWRRAGRPTGGGSSIRWRSRATPTSTACPRPAAAPRRS